jgi:CheY-like chemotaxis protein
MNVLYVEDYAVQARLVRDAMRRRAPQIALDLVPTVAQALERLRAFEAGPAPVYDLVLADLSLPDGSGLEILAHVRGRGLPLAVVMLTGDDGAADESLFAGADDHVCKQGGYLAALPGTLHAALERFCARSGGRGRAGGAPERRDPPDAEHE